MPKSKIGMKIMEIHRVDMLMHQELKNNDIFSIATVDVVEVPS